MSDNNYQYISNCIISSANTVTGTKTHKRLKERFLSRRNRTKHAHVQGKSLFQATYNNRKQLNSWREDCNRDLSVWLTITVKGDNFGKNIRLPPMSQTRCSAGNYGMYTHRCCSLHTEKILSALTGNYQEWITGTWRQPAFCQQHSFGHTNFSYNFWSNETLFSLHLLLVKWL